MSLDLAQNFAFTTAAAIGDLTATTITVAATASFPTPLAGLYNPDVGYNVTIYNATTGKPPEQLAATSVGIFRVTSLTSTVLTGYWTESTVLPTDAGVYNVIFGPTAKFRDDSFSDKYVAPYELLVHGAFDFAVPVANGIANELFVSNSTGWTVPAGASLWKYLSAATANTFSLIGRLSGGTTFDTGQVLNSSLLLGHFIKENVLPQSAGSSGTNLLMILGLVGAGGAPSTQYQAAGTGNGIFFRIDMSVSTTQLQCVVKSGATESVVNLTSTAYPFTSFHTFEIKAISSYAAFFIDGAFVALIYTGATQPSTNWGTPANTIASATMPTVAISWTLSMETLGATAEGSTIDWYKFRRPR